MSKHLFLRVNNKYNKFIVNRYLSTKFVKNCFYLEKYLSHPDKLPRPAILLDTAFAKMQKEMYRLLQKRKSENKNLQILCR